MGLTVEHPGAVLLHVLWEPLQSAREYVCSQRYPQLASKVTHVWIAVGDCIMDTRLQLPGLTAFPA